MLIFKGSILFHLHAQIAIFQPHTCHFWHLSTICDLSFQVMDMHVSIQLPNMLSRLHSGCASMWAHMPIPEQKCQDSDPIKSQGILIPLGEWYPRIQTCLIKKCSSDANAEIYSFDAENKISDAEIYSSLTSYYSDSTTRSLINCYVFPSPVWDMHVHIYTCTHSGSVWHLC